MTYAAPGAAGAKIAYKAQYDNFIGGKFVAPVKGQYFDVITPISGKVYTQAARSTAEDIDLALDAAHAAAFNTAPRGLDKDRKEGAHQGVLPQAPGDELQQQVHKLGLSYYRASWRL